MQNPFEIWIEEGDDPETRKIKKQFIRLQKQSDQMEKEIEEAQRVDEKTMQAMVF